MHLTRIKSSIIWITNCLRPTDHASICTDLAQAGINSLVIVDENPTPFPTKIGSLWCYIRPLAQPQHPSKAELQRMQDFVHYEISYGRTVGIWVGYEGVIDRILRAIEAKVPQIDARMPLSDACCCRPFRQGCEGQWVCHATPLESAQTVLDAGLLMTRPRRSGEILSTVATRMQATGQSDPADYFDYVCFANGNCVAPDIVSMQRQRGFNLSVQTCDQQFYPGVRFFFRYQDLCHHPDVAHDGIQTIKIREQINLDAYMVAAVVPVVDQAGTPLTLNQPAWLGNRLIRLDHRQHFGLAAWGSAALNAVKQRDR